MADENEGTFAWITAFVCVAVLLWTIVIFGAGFGVGSFCSKSHIENYYAGQDGFVPSLLVGDVIPSTNTITEQIPIPKRKRIARK